jgi:heme/copper-type cytochrome/quinol oxidase subunit 1
VGLHHLFVDPEHATGFKFLKMVLTARVSVPNLPTVFTISVSMEVAGRMRGAKGPLGQGRRVDAFGYIDPIIAAWAPWVIVSLVGGCCCW